LFGQLFLVVFLQRLAPEAATIYGSLQEPSLTIVVAVLINLLPMVVTVIGTEAVNSDRQNTLFT